MASLNSYADMLCTVGNFEESVVFYASQMKSVRVKDSKQNFQSVDKCLYTSWCSIWTVIVENSDIEKMAGIMGDSMLYPPRTLQFLQTGTNISYGKCDPLWLIRATYLSNDIGDSLLWLQRHRFILLVHKVAKTGSILNVLV